MLIRLEQINLDSDTHTRAMLDERNVSVYAKLLADGTVFPPIVVTRQKETYYIADGFHRVHAHLKLGRETIDAEVVEGTAHDAFLLGLRYDLGKPKRAKDRRANVLKLLQHESTAKASDRAIARLCGVSHKTVSRLRTLGEEPTKPKKVVSLQEHLDKLERTFGVKLAVQKGEVSVAFKTPEIEEGDAIGETIYAGDSAQEVLASAGLKPLNWNPPMKLPESWVTKLERAQSLGLPENFVDSFLDQFLNKYGTKASNS